MICIQAEGGIANAGAVSFIHFHLHGPAMRATRNAAFTPASGPDRWRHPQPRRKRMFDMPEFRRFFRVNNRGVDFLKFAMQDRTTFSCIA
jgi:hypothetical protein